uniref:Uncharacterized protein n=1 Tax=Arundo donax TaxID=35708 RepID=A0A0A9BH91_ARUDO
METPKVHTCACEVPFSHMLQCNFQVDRYIGRDWGITYMVQHCSPKQLSSASRRQ